MITEKMMEDAIYNDPEKYLGEKGLMPIKRQFSIGECRYDILFEDRYGGKLIVELQKGTLDRDHFLRIMYYQLEYKVKYPDEFTDILVIANRIPYDKRNKLDSLGIKWKEIPEAEFSNILVTDITSIKNNIKEKNSGEIKTQKHDAGGYRIKKKGNKLKIIPEIYDNIGSVLRDMRADRGIDTFTTGEIYELYVQRYPDDEEFMKNRKEANPRNANLWEYLPGMVSDYSKYAADGSRDKPTIEQLAPRTYRFI